jgi:hypothetical protein
MQLKAPHDERTSLPLYDLDEIIANLTLEDLPTTPTKPKTKKKPPPASLPSQIAQPPVYSPRNPSPTPLALYHFESPINTGYTPHWHVSSSTACVAY